jgi:hypothetical protein
MRIWKKESLAALFIIFATISFSVSQYYSSNYADVLTKTLGTNMILLNVREAMNEYLLRSVIPDNATNYSTGYIQMTNPPTVREGSWFEQKGNVNAYFNELAAFNNMAPYVNDMSWIFLDKVPSELEQEMSQKVTQTNALKTKSQVWFIIGIVTISVGFLISIDIFNRRKD